MSWRRPRFVYLCRRLMWCKRNRILIKRSLKNPPSRTTLMMGLEPRASEIINIFYAKVWVLSCHILRFHTRLQTLAYLSLYNLPWWLPWVLKRQGDPTDFYSEVLMLCHKSRFYFTLKRSYIPFMFHLNERFEWWGVYDILQPIHISSYFSRTYSPKSRHSPFTDYISTPGSRTHDKDWLPRRQR